MRLTTPLKTFAPLREIFVSLEKPSGDSTPTLHAFSSTMTIWEKEVSVRLDLFVSSCKPNQTVPPAAPWCKQPLNSSEDKAADRYKERTETEHEKMRIFLVPPTRPARCR